MNIQHLSTHLIYVKHHMLKSTDPCFFRPPKKSHPQQSRILKSVVHRGRSGEALRFGKGWEEWGESGRDPMGGREGDFFQFLTCDRWVYDGTGIPSRSLTAS